MSKSFSLYLDWIRFLAALGVLFDHLSSKPFTDGVVWWRLGAYGSLCVTIFFVLSGYVIAHSIVDKQEKLKTYLVSRIARLYSVVVPALCVTFLLDHLGLLFFPDFYEHPKVLLKDPSWSGYISSLFFVNEYRVFEFNGIAPGTNNPFWSLSFEAFYYVAAALLFLVPWRVGLLILLLLMFFAGRTIVVLMPVWFLGYFLYRLREPPVMIKVLALPLMIFTAVTLAVLPFKMNYFILPSTEGYFLFGRANFDRHILFDYFVAIVFSLNVIAAKLYFLESRSSFIRSEKVIRWMGQSTFVLYCFHYPVVVFFAASSPWSPGSTLHAIYLLCVVAIFVIIFVPITNYLKLKCRYFLLPKRMTV